jgi:hypothetical protein
VLGAGAELGIGFVPFSPLGKDFLTGTVDTTRFEQGNDIRATIPRSTAQRRAPAVPRRRDRRPSVQALLPAAVTTSRRRPADPQRAGVVAVRVLVGDQAFAAELYDNPTVPDLAGRLPVTLMLTT